MKTPDISKILGFVPEADLTALRADTEYYNALLHTGEGAGSDFLGWVALPSSMYGFVHTTCCGAVIWSNISRYQPELV